MSGGNGVLTSSPDNTNGDSTGDNSSTTLAFVGIAVFVGTALFIALYCIRTRFNNRMETLPSPLASPGIARDADVTRRTRHHGLALEDISLLPTFPYEPMTKRTCRNKLHEHKVTTVECAVCLGELEEGEMVRVLPTCKHYFHAKCIDMWLSTRSSCPMCRAHPEPEKVRSGLVSVTSPPWRHLMYSSSSERRQFSFGSCLSSPFVKTPSNKSSSPIGTSPLFHGSWQGSPSILTTPRNLQSIATEAHTTEISEIREIS